jgi:hypothetical protein
MTKFSAALVLGVLSFLVMEGSVSGEDKKVLFREDFSTLENWRPFYFPNRPEHTAYTIETIGGASFLRAESNGSASALIYKQEFKVYQYPKVRWRWKVANVYRDTDPETKGGDDYPMRVYFAFRPDPEAPMSVSERIKGSIVKKVYGEQPPHSTLIYVWANREDQKTILVSPYSDTVKVIALEKGGKKVGTWQEETVNIVDDYRRAFGHDPPPLASIAIMNDSDNARQRSVSYLDFVEVMKDGE